MELTDINQIKFFSKLWPVSTSSRPKLICLAEWVVKVKNVDVKKEHLTFISLEDNKIIIRWSPKKKLSPEYIPLLTREGENKRFPIPTTLYEIEQILKTVT